MKKRILYAILFVARACGLFRLARKLTCHDLRILCYHGAALADEYEFRGGLFVTPELFRSRMEFLQDHGYNILSLEQSIRALNGETPMPSSPTAITIDDGWLGTATKMAGTLQSFGYPATLYLSTYYVDRQFQVFNVAVDYVMWKASRQVIDLAELASGLDGTFDTGDPNQREAASDALVAHAESLQSAEQRQRLLERLCELLTVDYDEIKERRLIAFMNSDEARAIQSAGVDLQLHTHRHRFPQNDDGSARTEIVENREYLERLTDEDLVHFCYPSGEYDSSQFPILEELGIESATTTRKGFNSAKSHRYELTRFLDSENTSPIEFEAEMAGFFELLRRVGIRI